MTNQPTLSRVIMADALTGSLRYPKYQNRQTARLHVAEPPHMHTSIPNSYLLLVTLPIIISTVISGLPQKQPQTIRCTVAPQLSPAMAYHKVSEILNGAGPRPQGREVLLAETTIRYSGAFTSFNWAPFAFGRSISPPPFEISRTAIRKQINFCFQYHGGFLHRVRALIAEGDPGTRV